MASSSSGSTKRIGKFDIHADEEHKLGMGATGIVYSGINASTKQTVAGKKVTIETEFLTVGEFEKEADLLLNKIPPHENIIKVHEFTKTEYVKDGTNMMDLWLVMEYCELGNLKTFARTRDLSILQKVNLMLQSGHGVLHLHECQPESVAHRDIKPENMLITGTDEKPVLRLCDFGAAKLVKRNMAGKSITMVSLAGTLNYMAPEQVEPTDEATFVYNKYVDVFALGVVWLALLEACKGTTMTAKTVKRQSLGKAMWLMKTRCGQLCADFTVGPRIDSPADSQLESSIKDIIRQMIQLHPEDRPSMAQVVEQLTAVRDQYTTGATPAAQGTVTALPAQVATPRTSPAPVPTPSRAKPAPAPSPTPARTAAPAPSPSPLRAPARAPSPPLARTAAPTPSPSPLRAPAPAPSPSLARTAAPAPSPSPVRTASSAVSGLSSAAVPSSVQVVSEHQLQYRADWRAGLGFHGEVILRDYKNALLHKMDHDGTHYSHTWTEHPPAGFSYCSYIAVDNNGDIFLQDKYGTETIHFTQSLVEKCRYRHEGDLLDSCGGELFYGQGSLGDWRITVHRAAPQPPLTLQPARGDGWDCYLSVCRVQENYVVTERYTKSMDRFDMNGAHISHRTLNYEPPLSHAITVTNSGHILVAERTPPCIHVYNTQCEELASIGHKRLQLNGSNYVQGIKCSSNGLLHVCVGKNSWVITSFRAYRLTS